MRSSSKAPAWQQQTQRQGAAATGKPFGQALPTRQSQSQPAATLHADTSKAPAACCLLWIWSTTHVPGAAEPGAASAVARTAAASSTPPPPPAASATQRESQEEAEPQPEQVLENAPRPWRTWRLWPGPRKPKLAEPLQPKQLPKPRGRLRQSLLPQLTPRPRLQQRPKPRVLQSARLKPSPPTSHLKPPPQRKSKIFGCPRCRGNEKGCSLCLQPGYKASVAQDARRGRSTTLPCLQPKAKGAAGNALA